MNHKTPHSPIISIVTSSFNQGQFLAEKIESVIGQAGEFVIDYIIVDGGSSDNSVDIIRHYEGLLQRWEWPMRCGGINFYIDESHQTVPNWGKLFQKSVKTVS